MKIIKDKDARLEECLLVVPETEFEEQTLMGMYKVGCEYRAYVKCGFTASERIGIKITTQKVTDKQA